jgi:hypothetical protein
MTLKKKKENGMLAPETRRKNGVTAEMDYRQ